MIHRTLLVSILCNVSGTLLAAVIGMSISHIITNRMLQLFLFPTLSENFSILLLPVLILTVIVSSVTTTIEYLRYHTIGLTSQIQDIKDKLLLKEQAEHTNATISIKEKGNQHLITCADIIYLSSHGKRTLLHTEAKDYETIQLLKQIEEKLPDKLFVRVHKQFIVNLTFLSHIQYYQGGRYLAYLKDEDETTLPIGRAYVTSIKEKIK